MDEKNMIDSRPSIKVDVAYGKDMGFLFLSCLYGSQSIQTKFKMPKGRLARFYCPFCERELKSTRKCERCDAPMIPLAIKEGGLVQFCSRKGCNKPLIEFENLDVEIRAFYDTYSVFFK